MEFHHIPVMLHECMEGLNIQPEGIYVDGTAGGAGHSSEIAKRLTKGRLIALDQDPDAIAAASERLKPYPAAQVIRANFRNMTEVLAELSILRVNGVLLDLGSPPGSWTRRSGGFPTRRTHRWICGCPKRG